MRPARFTGTANRLGRLLAVTGSHRETTATPEHAQAILAAFDDLWEKAGDPPSATLLPEDHRRIGNDG